MNKVYFISTLVFAVFLNACTTKKQKTEESESSVITSSYLGQKPPELSPIAFAPNMVTTPGWEYGGTFTPDLKEFYFIRDVKENEGSRKQEFVVFQFKNNKWQDSVISPRVGAPFISPDGKRMYLGKRYKEHTNTGDWSETKKLGAPFDSLPIMRLTASSKGTYFFDEFKRDFTDDIRYSRIVNGKYEEPKLLPKKINS